jgi:hypothetical protein
MPRLRITSMFVAAALLAPAIAAADVTRFSVVDAASSKIHANNLDFRDLVIAGTVEGRRVTRVYYSADYSLDVHEQCLRLATLVLSKPGKYHLDIEFDGWQDDQDGALSGCTLVRTP